MGNKKFTAGLSGIAKAVAVRAAAITFVLTILSVMFFRSVDMIGAVFWFSLIGSAIWEASNAVTLEVRADGVSICKAGSSPVFYKYEKWYLSPAKGKLALRAEMRELDKTEDIVCRCFPKKRFDELAALVKKRQDAYFQNRRNAPAGNSLSREEYIAEAIATAAERNPYAKKKAPAQTPAPAKSPAPAQSSAPVTAKPAEAKADAQLTNQAQPVTVHIEIEPTPSKHDHGEDFHKAVFYYPRRDIEERIERGSTIAVLTVLFLAVAAFLVSYIAAPELVIAEGSAVLLIGAVFIALILGSKAARLRGMPSKLEVTQNHFVVDNTRYRFGEMSDKSMTNPKSASGSRSIRFMCGGKQVVCSLGSCAKNERRADGYFGRYGELCALLKEKGFKCL